MSQKDNNEHLSQNETDNIFPFLSPLRTYDKLRGENRSQKEKICFKTEYMIWISNIIEAKTKTNQTSEEI